MPRQMNAAAMGLMLKLLDYPNVNDLMSQNFTLLVLYPKPQQNFCISYLHFYHFAISYVP